MSIELVITAALLALAAVGFVLYGWERHNARHKPQRILERLRQKHPSRG